MTESKVQCRVAQQPHTELTRNICLILQDLITSCLFFFFLRAGPAAAHPTRSDTAEWDSNRFQRWAKYHIFEMVLLHLVSGNPFSLLMLGNILLKTFSWICLNAVPVMDLFSWLCSWLWNLWEAGVVTQTAANLHPIYYQHSLQFLVSSSTNFSKPWPRWVSPLAEPKLEN